MKQHHNTLFHNKHTAHVVRETQRNPYQALKHSGSAQSRVVADTRSCQSCSIGMVSATAKAGGDDRGIVHPMYLQTHASYSKAAEVRTTGATAIGSSPKHHAENPAEVTLLAAPTIGCQMQARHTWHKTRRCKRAAQMRYKLA